PDRSIRRERDFRNVRRARIFPSIQGVPFPGEARTTEIVGKPLIVDELAGEFVDRLKLHLHRDIENLPPGMDRANLPRRVDQWREIPPVEAHSSDARSIVDVDAVGI